MEVDVAAALKKLAEAAKSHGQNAPRHAALTSGIALLGGATVLAYTADLQHISTSNVMMDEPTAPDSPIKYNLKKDDS